MPYTGFILILTDDDQAGQRLRDTLREDHGHSCKVVASINDALESIRQRIPDAVVVHARMHSTETLQPVADLLDSLARDATMMVVGNPPDVPQARRIKVVRIPEWADDDEHVRRISGTAAEAVGRREDRLLEETIEQQSHEPFEGIVGISPAIRKIIERIKKAARNKLTVLILGETGTGKDLIARAIHNQSDRASQAWKPLNCAGLNENLLESELFGHVKGAYTGAVAPRNGYFVDADGGTLFLDEIGDMPLTMQVKLLRVLETREVTPVGSTEVRRVDVRVVAATNADLWELKEEGKFREDLFFRLNQWVIEVPPLRERREDIPILSHYLLRLANERHGVEARGISSEAMAVMTRYTWPGNVRELANVMEVLAVEVEDRRIELDDLPERISGPRDIVPVSTAGWAGLTMAEIERLAIERALQATQGNREQAAKMLDIGTRTLYRKIKDYGL